MKTPLNFPIQIVCHGSQSLLHYCVIVYWLMLRGTYCSSFVCLPQNRFIVDCDCAAYAYPHSGWFSINRSPASMFHKYTHQSAFPVQWWITLPSNWMVDCVALLAVPDNVVTLMLFSHHMQCLCTALLICVGLSKARIFIMKGGVLVWGVVFFLFFSMCVYIHLRVAGIMHIDALQCILTHCLSLSLTHICPSLSPPLSSHAHLDSLQAWFSILS